MLTSKFATTKQHSVLRKNLFKVHMLSTESAAIQTLIQPLCSFLYKNKKPHS